jgi:predicted alpha/beta hydrolase family esterase
MDQTDAKVCDVLFVQGGGAGTYEEWDARLVASLRQELSDDYAVRYPRMPKEGDPSLATWGITLEREVSILGEGAILVGHSVGGAILIHTLASRVDLLTRAAAIYLVAAPFIGDRGWHSDDFNPEPDWSSPFADIDVCFYHGDADDIVPIEHLYLYGETLPRARLRRLNGHDHQLNNDLSEVARDIRQLRHPA